MTVGTLKKLLEPLNDGYTIIVAGPCQDDDGDECEVWFSPQTVTEKMEPDTGEHYASFECVRLDNFEL